MAFEEVAPEAAGSGGDGNRMEVGTVTEAAMGEAMGASQKAREAAMDGPRAASQREAAMAEVRAACERDRDMAIAEAKAACERDRDMAIAEARAAHEREAARQAEALEALSRELEALKRRYAARSERAFDGVKPKFFDAVYDLIDHSDGAKALTDQLADIRDRYEEYFLPPAARAVPAVVLPSAVPPRPDGRVTLSEAMRRANAGERVDVRGIG